jgi:hypothetical protein
VLGLDFADPLETYSTSEHLYSALNIPAEAKGVLPRDQRGRAGLEAETLEDIGETGKTRSRTPAGGRTRDRHTGSNGSRTPGDSDGREAELRTPRSRRRTRAGQPAGGGTADAAGSAESADSDAMVAANHIAPSLPQGGATVIDGGEQSDAARRPRRRRSSRGRSGSQPAASA